jgi:hypothetical protein
MLQTFTTPVLSRFISASLFSLPQVKMKWKGLHFADLAEIQAAVTDELKKVQKEEFSELFRNSMTAQKPVYVSMVLILNKKAMCLLHLSSIFKKIQTQNLWTTLFMRDCKYVICNL